jgi:hypothetical protein
MGLIRMPAQQGGEDAEAGVKHFQLCRGLTPVFAGTLIVRSPPQSGFATGSAVLNCMSGRWAGILGQVVKISADVAHLGADEPSSFARVLGAFSAWPDVVEVLTEIYMTEWLMFKLKTGGFFDGTGVHFASCTQPYIASLIRAVYDSSDGRACQDDGRDVVSGLVSVPVSVTASVPASVPASG